MGSPLNTPIRPFVWFLNVSGAPTVMSSCSALTLIVSENPASTNTFALQLTAHRRSHNSRCCADANATSFIEQQHCVRYCGSENTVAFYKYY